MMNTLESPHRGLQPQHIKLSSNYNNILCRTQSDPLGAVSCFSEYGIILTLTTVSNTVIVSLLYLYTHFIHFLFLTSMILFIIFSSF